MSPPTVPAALLRISRLPLLEQCHIDIPACCAFQSSGFDTIAAFTYQSMF